METQRLLDPDVALDSENGLTENDKAESKRSLLVNLEGGDWLLTTLLITLDAILLELYQSESTKYATFITWFYTYECSSGWVCELARYSFIMAVAVVNVSLLIPVINVNVRTPPKSQWRAWLLMAWVGLLMANAMTIWQVADSIQMCINHEDDVESWTAHFWLIFTAVVLVVLLDVRFVYLYGWFTFFTCNEDQALKTKQGLVQVHYNESGLREQHIQEHRRAHEATQSLLGVVKAPQFRRFNTNKFLDHVSNGFTNFVKRRDMFSRRGNLQFACRREESGEQAQDEHMRKLLGVSWIHSWRCYISGKVKRAYTEVAEVENVFEYSSWIKSAAIFAVLMLIYNCIKTTEILFDLASSWDAYHSLASRFQDELSNTHGSLAALDQSLVAASESAVYDKATAEAVNATLTDVMGNITSLNGTIETFERSTGTAYDIAGSMLDVALLTTAKLVNITDLKGNAVVSAFFYIDSIIPILRYTCIVGYPIGTLIGLTSLYEVLVQHKRMSLALEQALSSRTHALFGKEDIDEEDAKTTLLGIDKKYQIGGAVYFFGILMSTAVVQQHIFGFVITALLAVIVDLRNFDILLNIGGYLVLIYLVVMMTNLMLTHIIGDRLLTREGFQIEHPWLFFLYLFTFSMVHAVLGFLYALWRAVLLLATTFWVLNRLDISLFLTGKWLDNGHYSFMSMLLLTRVIRLTNIAQGYVQAPTEDHSDQTSDMGTSTGGSLSFQDSGHSEFRNQGLAIAEEDEDVDATDSPRHPPATSVEIEAQDEAPGSPANGVRDVSTNADR